VLDTECFSDFKDITESGLGKNIHEARNLEDFSDRSGEDEEREEEDEEREEEDEDEEEDEEEDEDEEDEGEEDEEEDDDEDDDEESEDEEERVNFSSREKGKLPLIGSGR
jgi:hypothetical protein